LFHISQYSKESQSCGDLIIMQIVTSWMEQGIEQGIEQGRQEEALALILRQLPRRVGAVMPELQERICQLSLTQLEHLAEALLDFSSSEDLVTWLDNSTN
jgi:hypothetical protein